MDLTPSTQTIAIYGAVLATITAILGWLNFRRDRYKVTVELQWDAGEHYIGMKGNVIESWGEIRVINKGWRPAFITYVGLDIPGQQTSYGLLRDEQCQGVILPENVPLRIKVPQDFLLMRHAKVWKDIRAVIADSHGKHYKSKKAYMCPSWAKEDYESILAERAKRIEKIRQQELRAQQTSRTTTAKLS